MIPIMKAALYLGLFLVAGVDAFAQTAVAEWFPLNTGDRWIYDVESREMGEGPGRREIHRLQIDRTVTGRWSVPEGTLVETYVRFVGGAPPPQYRPDHAEAYLIRGDGVYLRFVKLDQRDHQLTPAYRQDLLAGRYAPDFCFPLAAGKTWGGEHWSDGRRPVQTPEEAKDWQVTGIEAPDPALPEGQPAFHIINLSSVMGSGEKADIWFEKGVGVVRTEQVHSGTFWGGESKLLRFEAAPSTVTGGH
jgi:hypothetical protein